MLVLSLLRSEAPARRVLPMPALKLELFIIWNCRPPDALKVDKMPPGALSLFTPNPVLPMPPWLDTKAEPEAPPPMYEPPSIDESCAFLAWITDKSFGMNSY